ncbi:uncharacterized protein LOC144477304 [Augochlora pura]
MVEEKQEFKSQIHVSGNNKQVDVSRILKDGNNLINKKGMKRNILTQRKKTGLGKKMKAKDKIHEQNSENVNPSLNYNNTDAYKCQFGWSKLILQYLPHNLRLTQDELKILFTKYKLDGHFEANGNSRPLFSDFLNNRQNTMNDENYFSNKSKHTFDTQRLHYSDNRDTYENLYNNNVNENQQNFKHDADRQQENHISEMCDIGNHFPSNSANIENIFPEQYGNFHNENNNFSYNVQDENFQNISGDSQQCDMQHIDQPWNSNMYYDLHMKERYDDMVLINGYDDYQLWINRQSNDITETSNSEYKYGAQIFSEQNDLNMYSSNVNPYNFINNENSDYTATTNYNYHAELDVTNTSASLISSSTNIVNDYI